MSEFVAKVIAELDDSQLKNIEKTQYTLNNIKPNTSNLVSQIQSALNSHTFTIKINSGSFNGNGLVSDVKHLGVSAGKTFSASMTDSLKGSQVSAAMAKIERDNLQASYNALKSTNKSKANEVSRAYNEYRLADKRYTEAFKSEQAQILDAAKTANKQQLIEAQTASKERLINFKSEQAQKKRLSSEQTRLDKEKVKLGSSTGAALGGTLNGDTMSSYLKDKYATGSPYSGYNPAMVKAAGTVNIAGREFQKFNVEVEDSDGMVRKYTTHIDTLTGEVYELNKGLYSVGKNAKRSNSKSGNNSLIPSQTYDTLLDDDYIRAARERANKKVYGNTYSDAFDRTLANGGSLVSAAANGDYDVKTQKIEEFGSALTKTTESAKKYIALPIAAAAAYSVKAFTDYETAFTGVRKTVDGTDEELQAISDGIEEMALRVPVASTQLAEIAQIGGQLGVPTEQLLNYTETFAALQTATNLQGEEGASTLARLMNVLNESYGSIENVGSAIVDLGNHTATTEKDIATMATRMGASATIIGMSTPDVLGYSAALSSLGVESEMGGSAMTRIWQDIDSAVSKGGDGLSAYAKKAKMSANDFAKAWKGNPTEAFNALLKGLSESKDIIGDLSDLGIGNVRDIQSLEKLAGRYDLVTACLQRANQAYAENTALQNEADRAYDTTASKLQMAKESFVQAARDVGGALAPTVISISQSLGNAAKGFSSLDESTQKSITSGALWTAGSILAVNTAGKMVEGVANVRKGVSGLAKLFGVSLPSVTKLAAVMPQVAVGLGVVAGGAIAAKVAYDAWYKKNYQWSEDFSKQAEVLKDTTNSYTRLSNLKAEYAQAKSVLSSPVATTDEIDAAKSKIEEIKQLLQDEYNLTITSDTTDLDDTIDMLTARQRYNVMSEGNSAVSDMQSTVDSYIASKDKLAEYDAQMSKIQSQTTALSNIRLEAQKLGDAWKSNTISEDEYSKKFSELKKQAFDAGITNVPTEEAAQSQYSTTDSLIDWLNVEEGALSDNAQSLSKKYADIVDQREKFKAAVESSNESFSELLANDIKSGNTDDIGYDTAKLLEVGQTAKKAGLNTDELAQSFATAKTGYTDFAEAISNGKAWDISSNFIQYKKDIGDFVGNENEVIQKAALIRNGFTEVTPTLQQNSDAIKGVIKDMQSIGQAQGINYSAEQLTNMAHAMNLIPDTKHIEFDVNTGDVSIVDDLAQKIDSFNQNSSAVIHLKVNDDGTVGILDTADEKLKNLMASGADIRVKFNTDDGTAELFNGNEKIGTVTAEGKIEWEDTETPQPDDKVEYDSEVKDPENESAPQPTDKVEYESEVKDPENEAAPQPTDKVEYDSEVKDPEPAPAPHPDSPVEYDSEVKDPDVPPASGTVNFSTGETPSSVPSASGTANFGLGTSPSTVSSASGTANFSLGISPWTVPSALGTANFGLGTSPWTVPSASGTANYSMGSHPTSAPTIFGTIVYTVKKIFGGGVDGTAHADGTAFAGGTAGRAFKTGDWGTKNSGVALGGELGEELVVRNGKFFTIGAQSAEMFAYKKGDIIFNAEQTKQIFEKGRITHGNRRGKALNSGTAFASGSQSEEDFDWIETFSDRVESNIDRFTNRFKSTYLTLVNRFSNLGFALDETHNQIGFKQQAYDRYMEQANAVGLDESWAAKIRDGEFDISTVTDDDLKEKIKDYQEWYNKAVKCTEAIDELHESIADLYKENFDNIESAYENILTSIEHRANMLDEYVDRAEERGLVGSTRYYEALQISEQKNLESLQSKKTDLVNALNDAVDSGEIELYSDTWYELQNSIDETTESIEKSKTALIEFDNKMREVTWDRFDYLQDRISNFTDESDFLIDLIGKDNLYEDNGELNKRGLSVLGLRGVNYDTYMAQASSYAKEIASLDKEIAENKGDDNLIQRRQELLKLQRESILAANDEKDAMIDLVKDGIDEQTDALKDLIDTYTDSLDSAKDLYEYQKKIKEHTNDIAALEKQLSAYENDTSEETKAKIQQIKVDLEEARQDLQDTEYDKYVSDQKELLDDLYDEYETFMNKHLDDIDVSLDELIDKVNNNTSAINQTLTKETSKVGTSLSSEMQSVWTSHSKALTSYFGNDGIILNKINGYFENSNTSLTGINSALTTIMDGVNNIVEYASYQAKVDVDPEGSKNKMIQNSLDWWATDDSNTRSSLQKENEKYAEAFGYSKNDGSWYDSDGNLAYSISEDDKIRNIIAKMKANSEAWHGASDSERLSLEKANENYARKIQSLTSQSVYKDGDGVWWIGDRELYSYKSGGLADFTGAAWLDGTPSKPELVLNAKDTENFLSLRDMLQHMSEQEFSADGLNYGNIIAPQLNEMTDISSMLYALKQSSNDSGSKSIGNIEINIPIEHVDDYNDFISQLSKDKQFEKFVRSVSVDLLSGGSTLAKNKYRW